MHRLRIVARSKTATLAVVVGVVRDSTTRSARAMVEPRFVGQCEISPPPARFVVADLDPEGRPYRLARLLVRFGNEPIGLLTVPVVDGEVDVDALVAEASRRFGPGIEALTAAVVEGSHVSLDSVAGSNPPAISVVIGTRRRPEHVVACVERLLKQDYPSAFEVIIVENGIVDDATRSVVADRYGADDRVRYMAEPRSGLSRARNIGLAAARYRIAAFLSDDIRVDPDWMLSLARGFARHPDVKAVTGFCPPAYLDTAEQLMFEGLMAWGSRQGFRAELHGLGLGGDPLAPYRPGSFANGSNMAFDTDYFRAIGGFDERLGPGTECRGGEDLDAPVRLLVDGHRIAFEPAAVGWHADRYDDRPFHQHMYTYGLGLTAFLTKHLLDRATRPVMVSRIPHGLKLLLTTSEASDEELTPSFPIGPRNHLHHLMGRIAGPFVYLRSTRLGVR